MCFFVPMVWPAALAGKLAFSLMVILAAFGYGGRIQYLKTVAVFYIVSFLMGGVTVGLMYVTGAPGLAANGSVYLHQATWMQVAAGVFVTWVLGNWLADFIRGKLQKEKVFTSMEVEISGKKWEMRAFVDTGNFLRDPVSGKTRGCAVRVLWEKVDGGGSGSGGRIPENTDLRDSLQYGGGERNPAGGKARSGDRGRKND